MAALQPIAPAEQPPPELPNMPDVSDTLSRYLRTFSLWCRNGFHDKLSSTAALPEVLLQGYNAPAGTLPASWSLQTAQNGGLFVTPIAAGSGDRGTPVLAGSSSFLPLGGGAISGDLSVSGTLTINGKGFFNGGASYGSVVGASPLDLSHHIDLWGGSYGFSITGGTLNLVSAGVAGVQCQGNTTVFGKVIANSGVSFGNFGYGGQTIRLDYDGTNWGVPIIINGGYVIGGFSCLSTSHSDSTYTAVRNWALRGGDGQVIAWYSPGAAWNWANGASDIRLKTNIKPAKKNALAAINALSVVECDLTYPFPNAKPHHWNWAIVANEDLGAKIPSAYIPAGANPDTHAIIRELTVIAALVKAVQQLSARVEELEAR